MPLIDRYIFHVYFRPLVGFIFFVHFSSSNLYASSSDNARFQNHEGVLLAQRSDIDGAIRAFEEAFRNNPNDETIVSNLATAYNNKGVNLVKSRNFSGALVEFKKAKTKKPEDIEIRFNLLNTLVSIRDLEQAHREAQSIIFLRPRDPQTLLKIAGLFKKSEDFEFAQNLLERVLELDSKNVPALLNLGQLFYHLGNLSGARSCFEEVLEFSSGNASITEFLRRICREEEIQANFDSKNSVHFTITFENDGPKEWIDDLLEFFEEGYQKIGELFNWYPSQRTQVIVYSRPQFHKISFLPYWAGGLYDGKIRLPFPQGNTTPANLRGAVFHEYCHHLVHILGNGRCPTWLNEGLAQLAEGVSIHSAKDILNKNPNFPLIQTKNFTSRFSHSKTRSEAERLYAQSLIAVSLIEEEKGLPGIRSIISFLGQGCSLDETLFEVLGKSCENLDKDIREFLDQP
ncbi:tetratricopeptide repeat protein [bacterium]|nr:tetratricopeptide repeat protein [bacterium]